jgi:hypothetical protein
MNEKPKEWEELNTWCSRIGYSPMHLRLRLMVARIQRRQWQEALDAASPENQERIAALATAIAQAQPLLNILDKILSVGRRRGAQHPDGLVSQIEAVIGNHLIAFESLDPIVRLPKHRPRDPWIKPYVLGLARSFGACGVSTKQICNRIAQISVFAGHGDLITASSVRHILRQGSELA